MVSMNMQRFILLWATAAVALPSPAAQDMLLEAQLEPAQVYVQAQALYRLRFYHAVDVRDLSLHAPSARVADLLPLGEARVYETLRDGRRYRVHERSYAVFPFASGPLQLAGAHAAGRVAAAASKSADGRQAMRIEAPPQTLTVLPAPAGDGNWLPAQALTLSETWSADGAAQRRTVRIEATGVDAAQLPELRFAAAGITVHAQPARLENRIAGEHIVGVREQSFMLTPTRAGDIALPALHLPWWKTDGTPMTATLPARTLQGLDGVPPVPAAAAQVRESRPLRRLPSLPLLLAVAAVLGVVAFWFTRRRDAWRLRRICRHGDARALRAGLLAWAARAWRDAPPRTLAALATRLPDAGARDALGALERHLYGPDCGSMDAPALRAVVRQVLRGAPRKQYDLSGRQDNRYLTRWDGNETNA